MGSDGSKLKHSASTHENLPSINLPATGSFYEGCTKDSDQVNRSRTGSASSHRSNNRHPLPLKMRRLIQGCFVNPHELVGRRIMKRACDLRPEFASFYGSLEQEQRDDLEDSIKMLLKKVVTNIEFVDEIQKLSEDFGQKLVGYRVCGFKADFFAIFADATIKECTHLDSAVHKAHTTTQAFSQFGQLVFSSVRDGFYTEVRRIRRASNSFSTGSNGSCRRKRMSTTTMPNSPTSDTSDTASQKGSRGNSPRASFSRSGSPRSDSPESSLEEPTVYPSPEFLKPTSAQLLTTRSY
ncbi:unnamed protein product [Caenorhabditis auriculariae]|uniref:Uncharacterized protein n=1 Tax=Caenorhabditis auriculariae TaxID=2777116 RepID=A0A8S1HBT2_9PELO|nr:unnamed protein product [Caenorhabditis auriculariae]